MQRLLKNTYCQLTKPEIKIFFIGFNKCGTTSLHKLLVRSGIRSAHFAIYPRSINIFSPRRFIHKIETNLAVAITSCTTDEALKSLLAGYSAYSDLCFYSEHAEIEACLDFRRLYNAFPNSFFILNDRSESSWIRSRLKHRNQKGSLLERAMIYHNADAETVIQTWVAMRARHHADVFSFFRGNDRFLHFDILTDPITKLTRHLAGEFSVNPNGWGRENAHSERPV